MEGSAGERRSSAGERRNRKRRRWEERGEREQEEEEREGEEEEEEEGGERRKEKNTKREKKKKLLILDVNGLLVDTYFRSENSPRAAPHACLGNFLVYKRPFCDEFVQFCLDNFLVGIWSSARWHNVDRLVKFIFGRDKAKLAFTWHQEHCTDSGFKAPENEKKPLFLKELSKLWEKLEPNLPWKNGEYGPANTLLIDDTPYKALRNPPSTAIFPVPYNADDSSDSLLGSGLMAYLEGVLECANVQQYVENNPFGEPMLTSASPYWWSHFYQLLPPEDATRSEMEEKVCQPESVKPFIAPTSEGAIKEKIESPCQAQISALQEEDIQQGILKEVAVLESIVVKQETASKEDCRNGKSEKVATQDHHFQNPTSSQPLVSGESHLSMHDKNQHPTQSQSQSQSQIKSKIESKIKSQSRSGGQSQSEWRNNTGAMLGRLERQQSQENPTSSKPLVSVESHHSKHNKNWHSNQSQSLIQSQSQGQRQSECKNNASAMLGSLEVERQHSELNLTSSKPLAGVESYHSKHSRNRHPSQSQSEMQGQGQDQSQSQSQIEWKNNSIAMLGTLERLRSQEIHFLRTRYATYTRNANGNHLTSNGQHSQPYRDSSNSHTRRKHNQWRHRKNDRTIPNHYSNRHDKHNYRHDKDNYRHDQRSYGQDKHNY